jgi:hypothetical protein
MLIGNEEEMSLLHKSVITAGVKGGKVDGMFY